MVTILLILTIAFDMLSILAGITSLKENPNSVGAYVILFFIISNMMFLLQYIL